MSEKCASTEINQRSVLQHNPIDVALSTNLPKSAPKTMLKSGRLARSGWPCSDMGPLCGKVSFPFKMLPLLKESGSEALSWMSVANK